MKRENYLEKVEGHMAPFLKKNGYVLIKSEFKEENGCWYLRLFIDLTGDEQEARIKKREEEENDLSRTISAQEEIEELLDEIDPSRAQEEEFLPGVDINDCAKVSRYLSKWLDKEDFIEETYTLEVCSRGFLEDNDQWTKETKKL